MNGDSPQPVAQVAEQLAEERRRYNEDADQPLGGYARVLGVYGAAVAAFAALLRLSGRQLPARFDGRDLVLITLATHKLARLVAKDPVTSPLRAPFTRFQGTAGPSELQEEVRGQGVRKAFGELMTCPLCLGTWIATAFAFGLVLAPRPTRLVASIYTALAGSDALQLAHSMLQERQQA